MLEGPRDQLARVSSRLAQAGGLSSVALAAEVVAYAYVAVGAALETALKESVEAALETLEGTNASLLSPFQLAAISEPSFMSLFDGERQRSRYDVKRALELRTDLVETLRAGSVRPGESNRSVLIMTGVPSRDHFKAFFAMCTGGGDPREAGASPPLERLVGRVDQVRGPRRDFAHECVDPTDHPMVLGSSLTPSGLAGAVDRLQEVVVELTELLDVLERACTHLANELTARIDATH